MFQLPLPIVEKLLRPIIVYVVLVLLLRLFGKRELAQLNLSTLWFFCRCRIPCRTRSLATITRSREESSGLSAC